MFEAQNHLMSALLGEEKEYFTAVDGVEMTPSRYAYPGQWFSDGWCTVTKMEGEEAYLDLGRGMLFRSHEAAEDQERQERQREAPQVPQEAEEGYSGMLRSIRRSNDRIADPELSRKMDRLEEIAGKILKLVEEDPAKKNQAATFLNYYLPTTEKLLDSYADFEEAGVSGENLTQAKEKIRRTMDSIVAGFERQLDALYHADAMDVDSDIRVMETMLRRDGGSVEEDFGLGGTAVATQEDL